MSDPTPPELPISVRRQMQEREEYVAVYGDPPALVGGPFFSGFLATRMAQARATGTPWEQDYYLGDPVHLLAEMRRKLPAAFVERQIARALFKLEYLLKKGLLASSIAQGDVEGMLAAEGFDPATTEGYPHEALVDVPVSRAEFDALAARVAALEMEA